MSALPHHTQFQRLEALLREEGLLIGRLSDSDELTIDRMLKALRAMFAGEAQ